GLKNCRITVEKLNQGKAPCQPLGWHIFLGRTSYLPYTYIKGKMHTRHSRVPLTYHLVFDKNNQGLVSG
ncbi:hypothetical protein ACTQ50_19275, partial [Blautia sp. Sow4_E7]|uniref:hypothetical protein n=1 Tax=Blautia sp. Sow4_E7 TaxID=3438749 RepID=UPI003F9298C3